MAYKNTVKDYSQMIGYLTRDKTTDVPGSMAHGLRIGLYDGGRAGFDAGGMAKLVTHVESLPEGTTVTKEMVENFVNKNKLDVNIPNFFNRKAPDIKNKKFDNTRNFILPTNLKKEIILKAHL